MIYIGSSYSFQEITTMVKLLILRSFIIGCITSIYFIPEIVQYTPSSIFLFTTAFIIQGLHDGVCLLFFGLYINSFRDTLIYLHLLNCLHGVIMMLFCYYKRCVLTLVYNHVIGIDMCTRYIPIWQRFYNYITPQLVNETCFLDDYRTTYLWLNNHILQSMLVFSTNVYHWRRTCLSMK
jgi:hypothetical protein